MVSTQSLILQASLVSHEVGFTHPVTLGITHNGSFPLLSPQLGQKNGEPVGGHDLSEFTQPDSCESPLGLVLGSTFPAVRE